MIPDADGIGKLGSTHLDLMIGTGISAAIVGDRIINFILGYGVETDTSGGGEDNLHGDENDAAKTAALALLLYTRLYFLLSYMRHWLIFDISDTGVSG